MRVSGRKAFIEEMFRMTPLFCSAMIFPKTWDGRMVPIRFRSKTQRRASAGRSKKDCPALVVACGLLPPAPLMRMSTRPKMLHHLLRSRLDAGFVQHIAAQCQLRRCRVRRQALQRASGANPARRPLRLLLPERGTWRRTARPPRR